MNAKTQKILMVVTAVFVIAIASFGVYGLNQIGAQNNVESVNNNDVILNNEIPAVPMSALSDEDLARIESPDTAETGEVAESEEQAPSPQNDTSAQEPAQNSVDVDAFESLQELYTNEFIPDLYLRYSKGWAFKNTTRPSPKVSNLLERTITLTKGSTIITFLLIPESADSCSTNSDQSTLESVKEDINNSGLSRFLSPRGTGFLYASSENGAPSKTCLPQQVLKLDSTIKKSGLRGSFSSSGDNLQYWLQVGVTGTEHLEEADRIITKSVLESK